MRSLLRRFTWWLQQRRKEDQLREELAFHLEQETRERRGDGLGEEDARRAARRDLGNEARVREDVRALWTWRPLDELTQDLRYAVRTLSKQPAVMLFATISLALGIGANTAIYSFVEAMLLRALPVPDPASLVVMTWRSKPFEFGRSRQDSGFVLHAISGSVYGTPTGLEARIFPLAAFERLQQVSSPVLSSVFAFFPAGKLNVLVGETSELADAQYVTADFFRGLAIAPAAGRLLVADDDRPGGAAVAVISEGMAQRRFGTAASALGQTMLINNIPFTIVGVTSSAFFGVDRGATPSVYLPLSTNPLFDPDAARRNADANYYWAGIMARLRPGVTVGQAEAVLAPAFEQWVASTTTSARERENLPVLHLSEGAGGLDTSASPPRLATAA